MAYQAIYQTKVIIHLLIVVKLIIFIRCNHAILRPIKRVLNAFL